MACVAHDILFLSFFFMFGGFNHQRIVTFVVVKMQTVHSRFTMTQRKVLGGERPEFLSLTVFLVILSFLSLSCQSSSSLVGALQSADSPFMADGGRGWGCWNAGTFQSGQQFFITAFLQEKRTQSSFSRRTGDRFIAF